MGIVAMLHLSPKTFRKLNCVFHVLSVRPQAECFERAKRMEATRQISCRLDLGAGSFPFRNWHGVALRSFRFIVARNSYNEQRSLWVDPTPH